MGLIRKKPSFFITAPICHLFRIENITYTLWCQKIEDFSIIFILFYFYFMISFLFFSLSGKPVICLQAIWSGPDKIICLKDCLKSRQTYVCFPKKITTSCSESQRELCHHSFHVRILISAMWNTRTVDILKIMIKMN